MYDRKRGRKVGKRSAQSQEQAKKTTTTSMTIERTGKQNKPNKCTTSSTVQFYIVINFE